MADNNTAIVTQQQGAVLVANAFKNQNDQATKLFNYQQEKGIISPAFGMFTPSEQVQMIPITAIWYDTRNYVYGSLDEEVRDNPEMLDELKESYLMHAWEDENGIMRSPLWEPIITVNRPNAGDPRGRGQVMLVKGYLPWQVALRLMERGWTHVPGLIREDYGDYRIEYASLFNKCQDSSPTVYEVIRHFCRLEWMDRHGLRPAGAAEPPSRVEAARAVGRTIGYFRKIGKFWDLEAANAAYDAGVQVRVLIAAAQAYGTDNPRLAPALEHIATAKMKTKDAEKYIKEENSALRLRDDRRSQPKPQPPSPAITQPILDVDDSANGHVSLDHVKELLEHLEDILVLLESPESKPELEQALGGNYKTFWQNMRRQRDIADEAYLATLAVAS